MTLAKELNEKLDEIIEMRKELARMNTELDDDATLTNIQTGEPQTKSDAIELIEDLIKDIYKQINKISNNGNNVNDIFTNDYYVNDFMQDREIVANANKQETNKKAPNNSIKNRDEYTLKGLHDKLYPNDPLYPKAPNNSNKKSIKLNMSNKKKYNAHEIHDIVREMERQYKEWLKKQKRNKDEFEGWQDPF